MYFIEHNDVQIHPFSCKRRNYILPYVSVTLHCLYHIPFIHSSVDGQLGYFHILGHSEQCHDKQNVLS